MKLTEHNERVLEKFATMIVERMEQMKSEDWKQGWIGRTYGGSPVNIDGRNYSGGNTFWLMMDCSMNSYSYPIYCTLKQVNKLGGHINKGAKSMPVIFWDYTITDATGKKLSLDDYNHLSQSAKADCDVKPFLKSYNVFNIEQTNLNEKKPEKVKALQSLFTTSHPTDSVGMYENSRVDKLLHDQSWLCPIVYDKPSDRAYYSPSEDRICVPMKSQFKVSRKKSDIFKDGQEFYSTLLHEMVHSTGTPSRLNRNTGKKFGDKLYAKEELVAELGAARIGQALGFDKRILDNNAAYLDGWISSLKKEPKFVLSLMSDVDKASRLILDKLAS